MATAFVTPEVLKWARERCGFSPEDLGKKIKVKPEKLQEWETSKSRPTIIQARKLAKNTQHLCSI